MFTKQNRFLLIGFALSDIQKTFRCSVFSKKCSDYVFDTTLGFQTDLKPQKTQRKHLKEKQKDEEVFEKLFSKTGI